MYKKGAELFYLPVYQAVSVFFYLFHLLACVTTAPVCDTPGCNHPGRNAFARQGEVLFATRYFAPGDGRHWGQPLKYKIRDFGLVFKGFYRRHGGCGFARGGGFSHPPSGGFHGGRHDGSGRSTAGPRSRGLQALCDLVIVTEAGNARRVLTLPAGMTSNGCVPAPAKNTSATDLTKTCSWMSAGIELSSERPRRAANRRA